MVDETDPGTSGVGGSGKGYHYRQALVGSGSADGTTPANDWLGHVTDEYKQDYGQFIGEAYPKYDCFSGYVYALPNSAAIDHEARQQFALHIYAAIETDIVAPADFISFSPTLTGGVSNLNAITGSNPYSKGQQSVGTLSPHYQGGVYGLKSQSISEKHDFTGGIAGWYASLGTGLQSETAINRSGSWTHGQTSFSADLFTFIDGNSIGVKVDGTTICVNESNELYATHTGSFTGSFHGTITGDRTTTTTIGDTGIGTTRYIVGRGFICGPAIVYTNRTYIDDLATGNTTIGATCDDILEIKSKATASCIFRLSGGSSGATPAPQLTFDNYYDSSGGPSLSHLNLYNDTYGFGISEFDLDYFTDFNHKFYTSRSMDRASLTIAEGKVGINIDTDNNSLQTSIAANLHVSQSSSDFPVFRAEGSDGTDYLTVGIDGHITASSNISASGLLYISASEYADTESKVLVRDSNTGRVYYTGSYGGGGGSADNLGNHTATQALNMANYDINNVGTLEAREKSFVIPHPTQHGKKLVYGALEGPEHGVYTRGRVTGSIIELPEEWHGLVHEESLTVQLTPVGKHQNLYVDKTTNYQIFIKNSNLLVKKIDAFYFVQGTRKDIKPLKTIRES